MQSKTNTTLCDNEVARQEAENRSGECIALFPGAFRPPHVAHLEAVDWLLAHPSITQVVIIISGRDRIVEGTDRVMTAGSAARIWTEFLKGRSGVSIEIASGTAVRHALEYVDRVGDTDSLYFVMGQVDWAAGDPRFDGCRERASLRGISAQIIPVPASEVNVHSTDLRIMLGQVLRSSGSSARGSGTRGSSARGSGTQGSGAQGSSAQESTTQGSTCSEMSDSDRDARNAFLAALPGALDRPVRERIWSECLKHCDTVDDMVRGQLQRHLANVCLHGLHTLRVIRAGTPNPVFTLCSSRGQQYVIKYAGHCLDKPLALAKSRRRLAVEKRMLSRLHDRQELLALSVKSITGNDIDQDVEIPRVEYWDPKHRLLMMSVVCPGGRTLQQLVGDGKVELDIADRLGRFLAGCHFPATAPEPVHGDIRADHAHWLATCERFAKRHPNAPAIRSVSRGLFHLDLRLHHVRFSEGGQLGVVDFESAGTVGDPAFDLGSLLGQLDTWAGACERPDHARLMAGRLLDTYRRQVGTANWRGMLQRVKQYRLLACDDSESLSAWPGSQTAEATV